MAKIDDSVKKKVPELRFPGFTDDWEERKLEDIFLYKQGQQVPVENQFTKPGKHRHRFIRIVDLTTTDEEPRYIEYSGHNTISATDLFMIRYGQPGVIGYGYEGVIANNLFKLIPKVKANNRFFKYRLDSMYPKIQSLSSSTTMPAISFKSLDVLDVRYPDIKEQEKIGAFFKQLDGTIALHQRKLDLLKEQKKGYLQKMFPKNGAKVPELRFAGFADDWEDRKLKDVTERVRSNDGRMDLPTLTMSASSGWLDQKDRFSGDISGKEKKNYTLLKKGELSYNHGNSKLAKYGVVFSLTNYEEALVPRVYHSFKALENTSADFIEYMFSTKLPDRELGKLVSSGARMDGLLNINYDDFMNIHISTPNYEEQILMSAFFRKLDENIALHQRKLDLLKEQKKGFLQKMFV
ncbi:restriction endonuclease subunit S [Lactococcus sp. FSL W8-0209]|uniref:restriction endonuclease subunit S n=1 Tax=Lactococcus sp. FSL W8-0209 TaxID=2921712 RepID=UPI0030F5AF50